MMDQPDQFQQNIAEFGESLNLFRQLGLEYAHDPENETQQMMVANSFKALVSLACQIISQELVAGGEAAPAGTKETVVKAYGAGLIADLEVWLDALEHYQKLARANEPGTGQNALDFSQTYFLEAVDELASRWEIKPA